MLHPDRQKRGHSSAQNFGGQLLKAGKDCMQKSGRRDSEAARPGRNLEFFMMATRNKADHPWPCPGAY